MSANHTSAITLAVSQALSRRSAIALPARSGEDPARVARIPPYTLRALCRALARRGHDPQTLLRGQGLSLGELEQPSVRVSFRQGEALIRRALQLSGSATLGIEVGVNERLVSWGLVGFGMMACRTLGESLQYGLEHQRQAGSFLDVTATFEAGRMELLAKPMWPADPGVVRFMLDEAFASIVTVARQLAGSRSPQFLLSLSHEHRASLVEYRAHLGLAPRLGAVTNTLNVPLETLGWEIEAHDPSMSTEIHALIGRALSEHFDRDQLVDTVVRALQSRLMDPPGLPEVAASINLSERSLRRRLLEQGTTYQKLFDDLRREAAIEGVRAQTGLTELADQLGFSDMRALKRAFIRWTGQSPRRWWVANGG